MRATIIDANGECLDLGDIEITAGAPNFTDTPAPPHDGRLFRPDDADRFPTSTYPPSSIVTVTSGGMTRHLRDDGAMMVRLQEVYRTEHQYHLPEQPKGWPDPNRRGARKTRRGRLP